MGARASWCKYWVAVINLFQMFHKHGAEEVRQFLAQSRGERISGLVTHLKQLRQSLRAAASHPSNRTYASVLLVLADLIDEQGRANWTELPSYLNSQVSALEVATPLRKR